MQEHKPQPVLVERYISPFARLFFHYCGAEMYYPCFRRKKNFEARLPCPCAVIAFLKINRVESRVQKAYFFKHCALYQKCRAPYLLYLPLDIFVIQPCCAAVVDIACAKLFFGISA